MAQTMRPNLHYRTASQWTLPQTFMWQILTITKSGGLCPSEMVGSSAPWQAFRAWGAPMVRTAMFAFFTQRELPQIMQALSFSAIRPMARFERCYTRAQTGL